MLKDKKLFLLDIDGTVCKGEQLISGTREFLEDLKESGGQYVFITNNATKSISDYIASFQKMGIPSDYSNFITASYATVQYLKQHHSGHALTAGGISAALIDIRGFYAHFSVSHPLFSAFCQGISSSLSIPQAVR